MTIRGYNSYIESVAFSLDGSRIVSGSNDGTFKVWSVADSDEVAAEQLAEEKGVS